jgi:hypothetical protein
VFDGHHYSTGRAGAALARGPAAYTAGVEPRRAGLFCLLVAFLLATGWVLAPDDDGLPPGFCDGTDDPAPGAPPLEPAPLPAPARLVAGAGDTGRVPVPTRAARPRPAPLSSPIPRAPPPA